MAIYIRERKTYINYYQIWNKNIARVFLSEWKKMFLVNNYFNSGRYFNSDCDVKLSLKFILNHYWNSQEIKDRKLCECLISHDRIVLICRGNLQKMLQHQAEQHVFTVITSSSWFNESNFDCSLIVHLTIICRHQYQMLDMLNDKDQCCTCNKIFYRTLLFVDLCVLSFQRIRQIVLYGSKEERPDCCLNLG